MNIKWFDPPRAPWWTPAQFEKFLAGEWFSGAPFSPEHIEEKREELRRLHREVSHARALSELEDDDA